MNDNALFLPGLSPVGQHDIHARFDGGALSSDGGVLLLREIERGLNFSGMLASCLHDARDPGRTIHDHTTMIRERMFAIACGYEDCDDLDALRHDPAFRIACERLPGVLPLRSLRISDSKVIPEPRYMSSAISRRVVAKRSANPTSASWGASGNRRRQIIGKKRDLYGMKS